jgi:Ca-activated chloride channel family protein
MLFIVMRPAFASAPGLNLYKDGKYQDAYQKFQDDIKSHPDSSEKEKIEFDAGAAAFKMADYNKALQSFSDALLSPDQRLQEDSHFNLGRTLEERADLDKANDTTLKDLTDSASHYEATLQLNPKNKAARANLEEVRKKIERLKQHPKKKPTPTPPPQQQQQKKKDQQQNGGGQNQDQDQQQSESQSNSGGKDQNQNQQQQNQQAQSQNQSNQNQDQKSGEQSKQQQMAKNESQKNQQQPRPGESPSPGQNQDQQQSGQSSSSPSPGKGENESEQDRQSQGKQDQSEQSPTPGSGDQAPTPAPGEGEGDEQNASPSPTPAGSPQKKLGGDIKGANGQNQTQSAQQGATMAEAQPEKEGEMSEKQAELLLQSMKDEEARVQLDERRVRRHVYNDW